MMKTILIIYNEKEVIRFETFYTKLEAQYTAIEVMKTAPSEVRYKIINEKNFLKL